LPRGQNTETTRILFAMFREIRNIQQPNSSQDLDDIAKIVLGEDEDDYIRSIDVYNKTIAFQNLSNMYRIYTDGLLEYKYLHGVNSYEKAAKLKL